MLTQGKKKKKKGSDAAEKLLQAGCRQASPSLLAGSSWVKFLVSFSFCGWINSVGKFPGESSRQSGRSRQGWGKMGTVQAALHISGIATKYQNTVAVSFGEDPLPDIQPELPLLHLHDISLGLIGGHQREQISNCPSIPPCEEIVDHITFSDVVYNSSQG